MSSAAESARSRPEAAAVGRSSIDLPSLDRASLLSHLTHQIAHELRNPCTIIGGFAALLKRTLDPADRMNEYADIILEETRKMEKSLDVVLNFSSAVSKERTTTDLNEIVTAGIKQLQTRVPSSAESITWATREGPMPVFVNREQATRSLFDILDLIRSSLPDEVRLDVRTTAAEGINRVELDFTAPSESRAETERLLAGLFGSHDPAAGLRLTLALESIKLNEGEFGLARGVDRKLFAYVQYPAVGGTHV